MKKLTRLLSVLIIAVLFFGCDKESLEVVDGTYVGVFTVTYDSGAKTDSTTLVLKDGNYTCSGNLQRIPAGGSGTYVIEKGRIIFSDKNIWTAEFDWNLILNGQYDYTFDGKKLKISARLNNVGRYEYKLEKIKELHYQLL